MDRRILDRLSRITGEEARILAGEAQIQRELYMEGASSTVDSRKLLRTGRYIMLRPHTRFIGFPPHRHNYVEMVYMAQGQTVHHIDGERVELNAGEILMMSPGAVQQIEPAGERDLAVNLILLPEFFDVPLRMLGQRDGLIRRFLVGCLCGEAGGAGYLHFRVADVLPIQNLMENMIWSLVFDEEDSGEQQTTMGLLFQQLTRRTDRLEAGRGDFDRDAVLSALRYVEARYRDGELTELAAQLACDVYWLSRLIKRRTGRNFTQLMQDKRLSQAEYLLANTDLPVADVAAGVGYDNTSYFYRLFEARYAMSPARWRAEHGRRPGGH